MKMKAENRVIWWGSGIILKKSESWRKWAEEGGNMKASAKQKEKKASRILPWYGDSHVKSSSIPWCGEPPVITENEERMSFCVAALYYFMTMWWLMPWNQPVWPILSCSGWWLSRVTQGSRSALWLKWLLMYYSMQYIEGCNLLVSATCNIRETHC